MGVEMPETEEAPDVVDESETAEPTAEQKLEALESAATAAKKVNKDLERKYKAAQTELDRLKAAGEKKNDGELDAETIKAEARKEALAEASAKANEKLLRAEIKAAAAAKLADPADALRLLDLSDFDVSDDGDVDEKAIADAIDDLLKKKPYLAAQGGKRFQGSGDGGARKGQPEKPQLTGEDIKGWSPEAIVKAKADGRLRDYLGQKT